jgi:Putative adhesin
MNRQLLAVAVLPLLLSTGSPATAWEFSCRVSKKISAGIDVAGATTVIVRAGAGDLDIRGVANATRVEARGGACASTQALLDGIRIETRRVGSVIYVETFIPNADQANSEGSASLNLGLGVPDNVTIEVTDSSGDTVIADVATLEIQDSSGELTIRRVAGAVNAVDSSGELHIDGAQSVSVTDSSGDINIRNVSADAVVESDTSGDIILHSIRGDATVRADSSGDIDAEDIGGDFHVGADGSGSITHRGVRGEINIPD